MVTETKQNMDYSNSAVNLTNSTKLDIDLEVLDRYQKEKATIEESIQSLIPQDLKDTLLNTERCIDEITRIIKEGIESSGSYQNLEKGWYAVKQRKVSKSYDAFAFEERYPQFAPAIIIKAVDTAKLTGLIKGGLISEADLKKESPGGFPAVITEKESFSYIIKV